MKAHVEILSGLIRIGPDAESYGDDFDVMVAFSSIDARHATLKGASMNHEGAKLTRAHVEAAKRELKKATGLDGVWVRARDIKP